MTKEEALKMKKFSEEESNSRIFYSETMDGWAEITDIYIQKEYDEINATPTYGCGSNGDSVHLLDKDVDISHFDFFKKVTVKEILNES